MTLLLTQPRLEETVCAPSRLARRVLMRSIEQILNGSERVLHLQGSEVLLREYCEDAHQQELCFVFFGFFFGKEKKKAQETQSP